jgi:CubicO group peptidase (beta-lactamase class C family)
MEFPGVAWARTSPAEAGFDPERLARAVSWIEETAGDRGYRLAVVKDGRLVIERCRGFSPTEPLRIASAAKSFYSNVLGIAVAEGLIPSVDAPLIDVYPEMMEVPEGEGPKEGRYAFPKDAAITYRQLIGNTSGYMKPGEAPGEVFHYQTYGMNILTHAVAKAYGLYDTADPEGSLGFGALVQAKVAIPIGATFDTSLTNFDLHARARLAIFGHYCQIHASPLDLARAGWLWANYGAWDGLQVVPEAWMRASVQVNPDIVAHAPQAQWSYGYGFWTNAAGVLWPELPRDSFTAAGAGGHYVSVFPTERVVIVQNPGPYHGDRPDATTANGEFLEMVLGALS